MTKSLCYKTNLWLLFAQVAVVVTEPMPEQAEDISTPPTEPVVVPETGICEAWILKHSEDTTSDCWELVVSPLALWFMYLMGKCIMNIRISRKYGNVQTRFVFRQKMETCSFTFGMSLYPCRFYSTCSTVTNWIYFITMLSLQYLLVLPLLM